MSGLKRLLESEDNWVTRMGAWFASERVVFRGQDLHVDLGDLDWMELYLYSITGRRFTPTQLKVLNAMWTYNSYPEPRLWANRVAALAGTARSTGALGISAGVGVSEASIYGRRPDIRAIDFLLRAKQKLDEGMPLQVLIKQELKKYRRIYGYGRPITREDERIPHMLKLIRRSGLDQGPYVRLAFEVERVLLEGRWRLHINIAALCAAIAADMDFTPQEYYLFLIFCFTAGMLPCFIDAAGKPEGIFFPLRCTRITYTGVPQRRWE